jgi:hypothetical protein
VLIRNEWHWFPPIPVVGQQLLNVLQGSSPFYRAASQKQALDLPRLSGG